VTNVEGDAAVSSTDPSLTDGRPIVPFPSSKFDAAWSGADISPEELTVAIAARISSIALSGTKEETR
jgi:hypothetical protein